MHFTLIFSADVAAASSPWFYGPGYFQQSQPWRCWSRASYRTGSRVGFFLGGGGRELRYSCTSWVEREKKKQEKMQYFFSRLHSCGDYCRPCPVSHAGPVTGGYERVLVSYSSRAARRQSVIVREPWESQLWFAALRESTLILRGLLILTVNCGSPTLRESVMVRQP